MEEQGQELEEANRSHGRPDGTVVLDCRGRLYAHHVLRCPRFSCVENQTTFPRFLIVSPTTMPRSPSPQTRLLPMRHLVRTASSCVLAPNKTSIFVQTSPRIASSDTSTVRAGLTPVLPRNSRHLVPQEPGQPREISQSSYCLVRPSFQGMLMIARRVSTLGGQSKTLPVWNHSKRVQQGFVNNISYVPSPNRKIFGFDDSRPQSKVFSPAPPAVRADKDINRSVEAFAKGSEMNYTVSIPPAPATLNCIEGNTRQVSYVCRAAVLSKVPDSGKPQP